MSVRSNVGYVNPEVLRPDTSDSTTIGTKDTRKKTTLNHEKMIYDARQLSPPITLDGNGVALGRFVSELKTFDEHHDKKKVRAVLYPETEAFVKEMIPGASHAVVVSSVVRSEDPAKEGKLSGLGTFTHAYARFAHLDAQDAKSEKFCRKMLRQKRNLSEEQTAQGAMDVVMVNVWKAYDRPVFQNPLTVLDCTTLNDKEELVTTTYNGAVAAGKGISQLLESAAHKWLYWPQMTPEEALVFKQMDTRSGVAKYGFHQAFDDPTASKDAPGRRSVELRVIVGVPKTLGARL